MRRSVSVLILLAAALVAFEGRAAEAGGGCHQPTTGGVTDESTASVSISECAYFPAVARVAAGDTLVWTSADEVPHTVTGVAGSWGNEAEYVRGQSVSYTFDEPGVYPYFCELHPRMVGAVVVGDGTRLAKSGVAGDGAVSAVAPGGSADSVRDAQQQSDGSPGVLDLAAITAAVSLIGGAAVLAALTLARRLPKP